MDEWMHTRDLCNHICIYTDTYVYQYMIPRRVIAIYTPRGKILQNLTPNTCVRVRARARAGVCARARKIVNKL